MQQRSLPFLFNAVFWLLYFLYEWLGLAAFSGDYSNYFINACLAFPLAFVVSYITIHILVKRFYDTWLYWGFWLSQIVITILLLLVRRCVNYYFIYPKYFPFALNVPFLSFGKLIVELVNVYLIVGFYSLFYFIKNWYEQRQEVTDLVQEKTNAELELLRSQIQPHFIFNTLNNIYSTALKTNPETAKLIAHLSSFLNYNLYDAKEDFVPLTSELAYIESYIQLQQNRYGEKLDISINVYDDINDISITPLLLLPLIENSFKHGISNAVKPCWLRVDILKQNNTLVIKIENSVEKQNNQTPTDKGGLGLKNVQRRLELIYPKKHEFIVLRGPHTYLVVLKFMCLNDKMYYC